MASRGETAPRGTAPLAAGSAAPAAEVAVWALGVLAALVIAAMVPLAVLAVLAHQKPVTSASVWLAGDRR